MEKWGEKMKQINSKSQTTVWRWFFCCSSWYASKLQILQAAIYRPSHTVRVQLLDGAFDEPLNDDNDRADNQCVLRKRIHINRMLFN